MPQQHNTTPNRTETKPSAMNADKKSTVISLSQRFAMQIALLLAASTATMACQPKATHPANTGQTVLVLTPGTQVVQPAEVLLQTQKVLNQRLQREGFGPNAVVIDGSNLKVTLPAMSAERLEEIKRQQLLRRGIVSLTPLVQKSGLFALLKSEAGHGISVERETWKGPDQTTHETHAIKHANKDALLAFLKKAKAQPAKGQVWAVQTHAKGGFAAYLLAEKEALKINQFARVTAEYNPNQPKHVSCDLTLRKSDAKKLHALSTRHLGNRLFIRIDRKVQSAPVIMAALRGSAVRMSMLSSGSTHPLIRLLGAGALPVDLQLSLNL